MEFLPMTGIKALSVLSLQDMKTTWRICQDGEKVTFEVRWSPAPEPISSHAANRKPRQSTNDRRPKQRTERKNQPQRDSSAKRRSRQRLLEYQIQQLGDGQNAEDQASGQGAQSSAPTGAKLDGGTKTTSGEPHVTPPRHVFAEEPVANTCHRKTFPVVHFKDSCMEDMSVWKVNTGSQHSPFPVSTRASQYSPPPPLTPATQYSPPQDQPVLSPARVPDARQPTEQRVAPPPGLPLPQQCASPVPLAQDSQADMNLIEIVLTASSNILSVVGPNFIAPNPCVLQVEPCAPVWSVLQQVQEETGLRHPIVLWGNNAWGQCWMVPPESEIGHQINITGHSSFVYDLNPGGLY